MNKHFLITGICLLLSGIPILSQNPTPGKEKFDNNGHRIFSKAEPLPFLESRSGPFIRLSDSSIFTVEQNICCISKDEGKTWTQYHLVDTAKFKSAGACPVQTRNGTIIVGFSNLKEMSDLNWDITTNCYDPNAKLPTYIICSKDNGKTWSEPFKLHDEWTGANRAMIETKDGHIVFSTMIMRNNPGRHCVLTYVSSDDGATWTPSNVLDNPSSSGDHAGIMEADLIQLNDGRLWMLIRTNWDYFYESFSSDDGLTWSAYQKTDIDASSSPGKLLRLQSGRIVLIWNRLYHKGKNEIWRIGGIEGQFVTSEVAASWQRDELSMMYSDNDGKIWSSPFVIAENIKSTTKPWEDGLGYPNAFEQSKGVIWITTGFGGDLKIAVKENDFPKSMNPNGDLEKINSIIESNASSVWLFTGNSITQGAKHTHGQRAYPEIFAERIRGEMGRTMDVVINTAISGHTSQNILDGFDQRVTRFQPNVVVLMIGTNDACDDRRKVSINQFESNLIQLIGKIRELNAIPVLLTPNPIITDKAPERKDLETYVIKIREISEKNHVILVDNWTIWNTELQEKYHGKIFRELLNDPLHPNGQGHKEIAIALFKAFSIFNADAPACGGDYYEGDH